MKTTLSFIRAILFLLVMWALPVRADQPAHVWEKQELTFTAVSALANPYTDVVMWVDLTGPGFQKRIYGFWDGDQIGRASCRERV